jgi:hypothetical protein
MAEITLHDATIILAMSRLEHLEGFRGDLDAPLTAVTAVRAVDDPWPELRGMRAPGTGLPGVVAVGTRRGSFGKDFAAVHGKGPGVVVEFAGQKFRRWVLTVDDPAAVVASVASAAGLPGGA